MTAHVQNYTNDNKWKERIREIFSSRITIVEKSPDIFQHSLYIENPLSSTEWRKASHKAKSRGLFHWALCLEAVANYLKRIPIKSNILENAMKTKNVYDLVRVFRRDETDMLGKHNADFVRIYQLRWEGRWEMEMELVSKLLCEYPNDSQCLVEWGIALIHRGQLDKADKAFQAALEVDRSLSSAHFGRGDICIRKGRIMEAVNHLLEAISHDPDYSSAWSDLGVCCFLLDAFQECEMCFKMACSWPNSPADAWSNLGVLLIHQGRAQEALPLLWMAVVKRPYEKEVWRNLFLAYHFNLNLITWPLRLPEISY